MAPAGGLSIARVCNARSSWAIWCSAATSPRSEDAANHMTGSVRALCPQPQCGKQLSGFFDDVAAGLGVAQLVGVGLDLPLRPGTAGPGGPRKDPPAAR